MFLEDTLLKLKIKALKPPLKFQYLQYRNVKLSFRETMLKPDFSTVYSNIKTHYKPPKPVLLLFGAGVSTPRWQ